MEYPNGGLCFVLFYFFPDCVGASSAMDVYCSKDRVCKHITFDKIWSHQFYAEEVDKHLVVGAKI